MRLLAVATAKIQAGITRKLPEASGGAIEHLVIFGDRDADYKASSLLRMTSAEGTRGHIMDGDKFSGIALSLMTSPEFQEIVLEAMDTLQRGAEGHAYRSHDLKTPADYLNYIYIITDRLAAILRDEAIDTVLFFDIPHLFYDSLLYRVAKHLGLRTLILRTAHIPQRFYSMEDITHLGHARDVLDAEPFPIEKGKPPELYYMAGFSKDEDKTGRVTLRSMVHLAAHIMIREPRLLLRPRTVWKILREMDAVRRELPDWRDPFWLFFHTDSLYFAEQLVEIDRTEPDLSRPFVYFPLQLQPEMTTSILGRQFRDQVLAIEALAAMLPDDHLIYVKENPKQDGRYRTPLFFHRLRRMEKVRLMPSFANTHALTNASRFVATISGTVAWEAITMGKSALVFGDSWMQALPGVVRYRPGLSFDEVAGPDIDHEALEQAVGQLLASSHDGILMRQVARLDDQHDAEANAAHVAETTWSILSGETPLSFVAPEARA